jgi:hypothetical protein
VEVAVGPAPITSAAAKTRTREAVSCAKISPGGANIGGWTRPQRGRPGGWCRSNATRPGPALALVRCRGRARQERPRDGGAGGLDTTGPGGRGGPKGNRGGLDGGGTGGLGWCVPDDGSGVLGTSTLRDNRGQAGRLGGDGAGLHVHGPSSARSIRPDELGWSLR